MSTRDDSDIVTFIVPKHNTLQFSLSEIKRVFDPSVRSNKASHTHNIHMDAPL